MRKREAQRAQSNHSKIRKLWVVRSEFNPDVSDCKSVPPCHSPPPYSNCSNTAVSMLDTFVVPTVISAQGWYLCYFHCGWEPLKELAAQTSGEGTPPETIDKYRFFLAPFHWKTRTGFSYILYLSSQTLMNKWVTRDFWFSVSGMESVILHF